MLENAPEVARMVGASGIFMMAAGANGGQQINKTRIAEAVIIACIIGIGGYFLALPVFKEQIDQLRREMQETRQLIRDIKVELDARGARRDAIQAQTEAKIVQLQIEQAKRR